MTIITPILLVQKWQEEQKKEQIGHGKRDGRNMVNFTKIMSVITLI